MQTLSRNLQNTLDIPGHPSQALAALAKHRVRKPSARIRVALSVFLSEASVVS